MVAAKSAPAVVTQPDPIENTIKQKVFARIGGVPKGFIRMTVSRVYGDTYRANVYVEDKENNPECFVKSPKIAESMLIKA